MVLATTVLAGCLDYGEGRGEDPPPFGGIGFGLGPDFGLMLVFGVLLVVAVPVLALLAVVGRGLPGRVAGALLLVLGLLGTVTLVGGANYLGAAVAAALAALGASALAPAPLQERVRTVVLGERGR